MFDTFDHPDMNVTAGARNVSTAHGGVDASQQPARSAQAQRLADRVSQGARCADQSGVSDALARSPRRKIEVGLI